MQLADSLGLGLLGRYLGSRLRSNRLSLTPHFGCGFGSALCHCGLLSCTSASQALLLRRGFRLFLLPLLPPPLCLAHLFSASTHVLLLGCLGQTLGEPRRELSRLDFSCAVDWLPAIAVLHVECHALRVQPLYQAEVATIARLVDRLRAAVGLHVERYAL